MNQSEEIVIRRSIKRLKADECKASPEVKALLNDRRLRSYIDTWVIGALECLLPESRDLKLAVEISR